MALKYKLDNLDGLEEAQKALYKQEGNVYILDVDGVEDGDTISLKNQVNKLLSEKRDADDKAKQAQKDADDAAAAKAKAEQEKAEKAGEWEQLAKSYKSEIDKLKGDIETGKEERRQEKINSTALEMAAELADGPNQKILSRFMADRLRIGENGELVVTDDKGNLTISTPDQLIEEFKSGADYASLITGSKATGSGAEGGQKGGGAAKPLNEMSDAERIQMNRDNPEEFAKLVANA